MQPNLHENGIQEVVLMPQQLSVNGDTHANDANRPTANCPRASSSENGMLAVGRVVFGGYFLYNGVNHFLNRSAMAQYAGSKQVPAPDLAVIGSGALALLGGLSLVAGIRPKVGASLIAAFLLGVTPTMHAFWSVRE